jgi:hypothetical protein
MTGISQIDGLPAHILLNHIVVVLGPLTAILAVLCAVWPAVRQRLIWLVLLLAVGTLVVTPLTVDSGGWLASRVGASQAVEAHAALGATLTYMVAALAATVLLLTAIHVRQARGGTVRGALQAAAAGLVIVAAAATLVQTYRVGESGARAAWGTVPAVIASAA